MKRSSGLFNSIPGYFRQDIYSQLIKASLNGRNTQLIGLKGLGKSLSLRLLETHQESIKDRLGIRTNVFLYLSDLSLLPEGSTTTIIRYVFGQMLGVEELGKLDTTELVFKIQSYIDALRQKGKKVVVILDTFLKLESFRNPEIFDFFLGLYKKNIDVLSFIFSVEREVDPRTARERFGDFGRLLLDNKIFFGVLNSEESEWFFESQSSTYDGKIGLLIKKKILSVSGGYSVIIKRLFEAHVQQNDVDQIIINPTLFIGLSYSLESMLSDLSQERGTLKRLLRGELTDHDNDNLKYLSNLRVTDTKNNFICPIFENYLKIKLIGEARSIEEVIGDIKLTIKLTSSEFKILNFLNSKKNSICSREEVIESAWGEKAIRGVADHALDQVMSRLRKKLIRSNSGIAVETLRGRGYRLVIGNK